MRHEIISVIGWFLCFLLCFASLKRVMSLQIDISVVDHMMKNHIFIWSLEIKACKFQNSKLPTRPWATNFHSFKHLMTDKYIYTRLTTFGDQKRGLSSHSEVISRIQQHRKILLKHFLTKGLETSSWHLSLTRSPDNFSLIPWNCFNECIFFILCWRISYWNWDILTKLVEFSCNLYFIPFFKGKILWNTEDWWFKHHSHQSPFWGKSVHSAAIYSTPPHSYFWACKANSVWMQKYWNLENCFTD